MFGFGMEELWAGYSMEQFHKIRQALNDGKMEYTYRVQDRQGQMMFPQSGTLRARTGSAGIPDGQEKAYVILVKKKDLEEAKYLIAHCC